MQFINVNYSFYQLPYLMAYKILFCPQMLKFHNFVTNAQKETGFELGQIEYIYEVVIIFNVPSNKKKRRKKIQNLLKWQEGVLWDISYGKMLY